MVRKLYTEDDYFRMANEANADGKKLIKVQEEREHQVEVLEWDYVDKEIEQQKIDPETGKPMYDEEGNPIMEIVIIQVPVPRMVEETIINPETGEEITVKVQAHHTETRTEIVEYLEIVDNPDNFKRCFFNTSLGYVRRKPFVKGTGEYKDFLSDMSAGLVVGQPIITYTENLEQQFVTVTEQFKQECLEQYNKDFNGETATDTNI